MESIQAAYAGVAGIGHVRYATCGQDDRRLRSAVRAAPLGKTQVVQLCFQRATGQLPAVARALLRDGNHHLARESDTEIIMHEISRELSGTDRPR